MSTPSHTAPETNTQTDTRAEESERATKKPHTSRGERLFDWLAYGGIGFAGVFAAGIPIAHWAKYGKGAKLFSETTKSLEKLGMDAKSAEDAVMTTVLMQPGNVALVPIKMLEDRKPELVKKLNTMVGDKSGDASVDKEPEQSWGSLIKARLAAWLAVFAGFRGAAMAIGDKKFAEFEGKFAEHLVCKPLGQPAHLPGLAKIAENETKVFRYGKIAALDSFATAAATILLYTTSRIFAQRNARWEAEDAPREARKPDTSSLPQTEAAATPADIGDTPRYAAKIAASSANSFVESVTSHKHLSTTPSHPL